MYIKCMDVCKTALCIFTGTLSVLKGPGREGLTFNNLFSLSTSDVAKIPQKSPSHAPLLINSCDGIQAWGDADHLLAGTAMPC